MKISLLFFSFSAMSALAPFYHSVKQMEDLMNSPELATTFGVDKEITQITRSNNFLTVKSGNCSMEVKSKIINSNEPKFEFQFGKLTCL
jgi:hypothetical protein